MVSGRLLLICLLLVFAPSGVSAGQQPPAGDGWVVLPIDEYRALRAKAYPVDPKPPTPPVDATVTRVDYDLVLQDHTATGTVVMTVDVLADRWVAIDVPAGLLIGDARLDGRPVSLVEEPSRHILLARRGRSVLTLQVALPIKSGTAAETLAVPQAGAASTRVTLSMPKTGIDATVVNGWLASTEEAPSLTRWVAHGVGDQPITFTWRRRPDDRRASQPLRIRGGATHLIGIAEDATQVTASMRVDVLSGIAPAVTLAIPAGLQISRVTGPIVADWQATAPGVLRVTFVDPVTTTTSFSIVGEVRGAGDGIIAVPLVRLPDADRESGGVAVEVLGAGEVTSRHARALDPADPRDLGSVVAGRESPSMVAYRFAPSSGSAERALSVAVVRYATQATLVANIDEARYHVLATEEGKTLVRARYAVRNNRRGLLSMALPAGATLWTASVSGRVVRPGRSDAGAVLVPLERAGSQDDLPPFVVEVAYLAKVAAFNDKGSVQLPLPAVDLPISRTGVVFYHSPRLRVGAARGSFRIEPFSAPASPVLRDAPAPTPPPSPAAPALESPSMRSPDVTVATAKSGSLPGILPLDIVFPELGTMVYFAAELTPETHSAALTFDYERQRGN